MNTIVPLTEARNRFAELVEMTVSTFARVQITKNGRPAALLISQEEYDSLMETMDILADKKVLKDLAEAQKEAHQGKVISLEQALAKWHVKI